MGAIICPGCIEMCGEENCFLDTSINDREGRKNDENDTKEENRSVKTNNATVKPDLIIEHMLSRLNSSRTSKSISRKEIPDSKVGVEDKLECSDVGGGGFFDQFLEYFD